MTFIKSAILGVLETSIKRMSVNYERLEDSGHFGRFKTEDTPWRFPSKESMPYDKIAPYIRS